MSLHEVRTHRIMGLKGWKKEARETNGGSLSSPKTMLLVLSTQKSEGQDRWEQNCQSANESVKDRDFAREEWGQ